MLFKTSKPKIFCIGFNKTGTTTLEQELKSFGYRLGNQIQGELLIDSWYGEDFKPILKFCKTADAFQDIPFSLPYTYQHLDAYFKDAKFILTERDTAEQWYHSLVTFHSKLFADGQSVPTAEDLKRATYRHKGYTYKAFKYIYNTPDDDLYNKDALIKFYTTYNSTIKDYFMGRPEKLLCINVSKPSDYVTLCEFLNQPISKRHFAWKNKTSEI